MNRTPGGATCTWVCRACRAAALRRDPSQDEAPWCVRCRTPFHPTWSWQWRPVQGPEDLERGDVLVFCVEVEGSWWPSTATGWASVPLVDLGDDPAEDPQALRAVWRDITWGEAMIRLALWRNDIQRMVGVPPLTSDPEPTPDEHARVQALRASRSPRRES